MLSIAATRRSADSRIAISGAGMLIQPGGLRALRELGAFDAFVEASVGG